MIAEILAYVAGEGFAEFASRRFDLPEEYGSPQEFRMRHLIAAFRASRGV